MKNKTDTAKDRKGKTKKEQQQKLKECQKLNDEYLAGWQRARADFLNYKKEEEIRIEGISNYKIETLILKILPILDSFDLAEKQLPKSLRGDKYTKGFLQIKIQIQNFLKSQGVEEIKSIGQKFDPNFQEIVEEVEVKDKEAGIVVEEVQKGYKLQEKMIRPAKVKLSK